MALDGVIVILSDMHFGRDILSPPQLPFTTFPRIFKIFNAEQSLLQFVEERCLGHNMHCVRALPRYLQYLLDIARDEGFEGYDFDRYLLVGDQVTIPDKQSYRFIREYLTEPEYKTNLAGFEKLILSGLRIDPKRIIAIPGNHDKLFRKDLTLYDAEFVDEIGIPPLNKQCSAVVHTTIGGRDVLAILIDANIYATSDGAVDATFRNHLACGYVTDGLEANVLDNLFKFKSQDSLERALLIGRFEEAIKMLVVHFAVDDKQVRQSAVMEEKLVPHDCKGLGRLVSTLRQKCGLDLVIHGHLHTPALYEYDRVPVLSATTATQEGGTNGFHLLKIFDTGEIQVEYHSWNGVAFAKDPSETYSRTLNPDYSSRSSKLKV